MPRAAGPLPMPQLYQASGSAQMMMGPQQPQSFAQPMIHPQQFQGSAQVMMGAQHSYGAPHAMNGARPAQGSSQIIMGPQQSYGAPQAMTNAQHASHVKMNTAELLSWAHSHMEPLEFLEFAKALTLPSGSAPAMSPQPVQASMASMQPLMLGASTPVMGTQQLQSLSPVMPLKQSTSSSGNSPTQVQDSTIVMSPQQVQAPSTPTMPKAQEIANSDLLVTPQRSQDPTGGMASPQQFEGHAPGIASPQQLQGYGQGMVAPQQFHGHNPDMSGLQQQLWTPTQEMISNMQTDALAQPLVAPQHTVSPTVNQTMMPNQGFQAATSGITVEGFNGAVVKPKIPTPYLGIIPPPKRQSQSSQLGMLHKFVARSPLAPVASTQNRVTKNSAPKPTARPQVPISPVSPPSAPSAETGLLSTMSAEIDELFEDADDENTSAVLLKPCALTLPVVEHNGVDVDSSVAYAGDQTFVNEYPHVMTYEDHDTAVIGHSVEASESNKRPAITQSSLCTAQGIPNNVDQTEIPPHLRVATPAEIDEMTIEQQYLYGIRQGLPNKGYPINRATKVTAAEPVVKEPVTKEPVIKEPQTFIIIDDPPRDEEDFGQQLTNMVLAAIDDGYPNGLSPAMAAEIGLYY